MKEHPACKHGKAIHPADLGNRAQRRQRHSTAPSSKRRGLDSEEELSQGSQQQQSGECNPPFENITYVPHALSEAKKARELFLNVFAGFHAPVTAAVAALGLDHFQPFDLDADSAFDILHDPTFELLLQVCWSGIVWSALFAPPCKEYSRLKLLLGGPPALRTPEHLDGLPDLKKVQDSKAIHSPAGDETSLKQ